MPDFALCVRMPAFATQNASSSYRRNEMSIKIQVDPARLDSAVGQIEQQTLCPTKRITAVYFRKWRWAAAGRKG